MHPLSRRLTRGGQQDDTVEQNWRGAVFSGFVESDKVHAGS